MDKIGRNNKIKMINDIEKYTRIDSLKTIFKNWAKIFIKIINKKQAIRHCFLTMVIRVSYLVQNCIDS